MAVTVTTTGRCPKCAGFFQQDGLCPNCGISCSHKFLDSKHCLMCGWLSPVHGVIARERELRIMAEKAEAYDASPIEPLLALLGDVFEFAENALHYVPNVVSTKNQGLTQDALNALKDRARALGLRRV